MSLSLDTTLGPYTLISKIGAGGMGEVYRARDTRLDREVAIKLLIAEVSSDSGRLKRFEQEARATSALNHPNILTVYDIDDRKSSRKTSRSDTQIRQCMHGMQRMHVHFF